MILQNTIQYASNTLRNNNIDSHLLDAELILADIIGVDKEFLTINNKICVSKKILKKYNFAIKRRLKREPVAYITGKKSFGVKVF